MAIRVLHVDDDADIRDIARMSLELCGGFELSQCSCGREALQQVEDLHPDALLLDFMMPEMSGDVLLREIRKKPALAEIPAIFMTAKGERSDIEMLKAAGALDVIVKPFDPMTLGDNLKQILNEND